MLKRGGAVTVTGVGGLKTLDRGLCILLKFLERSEWTISAMARELETHKSTIYRVFVTLERRGFVVRDELNNYRLGLTLLELGNAAHKQIEFRKVVYPVLKDLVRETQESAFLTVVSGDESVCIETVDSPQSLKMTLDIGGRYPLHAGASNKILMAYLPSDRIESIIAAGLPPVTSKTIVDPDELRANLAEIREQGWCYSSGEVTQSAAAVAVPVVNGQGRLVGGLSVAGLHDRFTPKRVALYLQSLQAAADRIKSQLRSWND